MLTQEGCLARRRRLWSALPDHVDWVLVADPRHVHYLCNFWVEPLSFSFGERAVLLLERSGRATLFADNFTLRKAAGQPHVDREVVEDWYDHRQSVINRDHALFQALRVAADSLFGRNGIVEAEWLPVGGFELLGLDRERHSVTREPEQRADAAAPTDLGSVLRHLRRSKEADEVALLRRCMQAGAAGQARALEVAAPGVSELEVYQAIQTAAVTAAGRPVLLYGDFRATNADTPKAGGLPTDRRLEAGDMLILDFSVMIDGYRSDFTNTIAIGSPSDEQTLLFRLVESALLAGETALSAGVPARDVYQAVAAPLRESGYGDTFTHHAGHGLGLAHPEPPILVPESNDTLLAGDVVTLEPGLYVPGIGGIRIEHNYLVTADGYERLSDHDLRLE